MFRAVFEKWRMDAIAVENGEAALTVLERKSFDLLVLDLNLPGMDGFWLAEEIDNRWPNCGVKRPALGTFGPERRPPAMPRSGNQRPHL